MHPLQSTDIFLVKLKIKKKNKINELAKTWLSSHLVTQHMYEISRLTKELGQLKCPRRATQMWFVRVFLWRGGASLSVQSKPSCTGSDLGRGDDGLESAHARSCRLAILLFARADTMPFDPEPEEVGSWGKDALPVCSRFGFGSDPRIVGLAYELNLSEKDMRWRRRSTTPAHNSAFIHVG
jgi:hypothetical protein